MSINDRFFKIVDVDGDGNCLPAAIAKSNAMQAQYSGCDHLTIRNLISSWISEGMQQTEGSILRRVVKFCFPKATSDLNGVLKLITTDKCKLDLASIALLFLVQLGIDVCGISNFREVSLRVYDPRHVFAQQFGKIVDKPIKPTHTFFHRCQYPTHLSLPHTDEQFPIDHYALLCPVAMQSNPRHIIHKLEIPSGFLSDDPSFYMHIAEAASDRVKMQKIYEITNYPNVARHNYGEFILCYSQNHTVSEVLGMHMKLTELLLTPNETKSQRDEKQCFNAGDLIYCKISSTELKTEEELIVFNGDISVIDPISFCIKIASFNMQNLEWDIFNGDDLLVTDYTFDENNKLAGKPRRLLLEKLKKSPFNPNPGMAVTFNDGDPQKVYKKYIPPNICLRDDRYKGMGIDTAPF